MTRSFLAILGAAMIALMPGFAAAQAQSDEGQVGEMIIKIMTPDGPKWFRLGNEVNPVDVTEGKIIQFDYLDDTSTNEAVTITPEDGSEDGGAE